jgi:predicted flavoprotein YhiN
LARFIFLFGQSSEELLVVVGGGAAGVFGAIRAKTVAPNLKVVVIEKGKPLSKVRILLHILGQSWLFGLLFFLKKCYCWQVKISGGGRCNVTNGHCTDNLVRIIIKFFFLALINVINGQSH